jgi:4-carboxymuconolactone decarboxylase
MSPRIPKARIEALHDEEAWTAPQRDILVPISRAGRLYNVHATMANHPALAKDWMVFAGHILRKSTLPARDRELLILRTGWLCQCEYEWAQHTRLGRKAGLSETDITNITKGPDAPGLAPLDKLLLQAADELHKDKLVSDATWTALARTYNTEQMMDLVFTVGQYTLVSMALNSFGVQLDEGLDGFPK